MSQLNIITGVVPALLTVAAALALGYLLARRSGRWWRRAVPVTLGGAAALTAAAYLGLWLWNPFPDALPLPVLAWACLGLLGVALAGANALAGGRWRRVAAVPALLLVLLTSAAQINAFYGYRPTLGAAIGGAVDDDTAFADVAGSRPAAARDQSEPLDRSWHPPAGPPAAGEVTQVDIPGTRSGFRARPALVYLPPAYRAEPRPLLPVLVLISGQPGSPRDWFLAGAVPRTMDAFAAANGGLAPIVVVPDGTGSAFANPLCLDSPLGNAETYLTKDVPDWVRGNLQVDPDTRRWAVGGFSYGGTCALQLAVRAPALFPTFLDISGQAEPSLGSRAETVRAAFGGDAARFHAVNPLDLLRTAAFPGSAGVLAAGTADRGDLATARQIADTARGSAMVLHTRAVPGGHSWVMAAEALRGTLPWLAGRQGLTPPTEPPPTARAEAAPAKPVKHHRRAAAR
ncbi:alpha/beta hydrolase-fold protein [Pseudonocardia eucalypti]|uniref:Alpha/beta hydrolase-fold protein n=1 Tax=Pseudonocardia eucalypti TaxID=648755 RepID=A0ABP9Q7U7_9PSEU|nr:S-formylglutathione hydrolase FrmB/type IV secretory pathway VirB2 component (pilin) [Pseudonocardia eucalypti]